MGAMRAGGERGTDTGWRDRNPVSMTLGRSTQTDAQEEGETFSALRCLLGRLSNVLNSTLITSVKKFLVWFVGLFVRLSTGLQKTTSPIFMKLDGRV